MTHVRSTRAVAARPVRARRPLAWSVLALLLGLGLVAEGPHLPASAALDPESDGVQTASWYEDAYDELEDFIDDLLGDDPDEEEPPADDTPPDDTNPDDPDW